MIRPFRFTFCFILLLVACSSASDLEPGLPFPLASFTENRVTVGIWLEADETGQTLISATFTPEVGYHLYSKDIPPGGVDGLGRPTLIALVPGSRLESAGALTDSPSAVQEDGPEGLLVYPEGSVTLRLPVRLPEGSGWYEEQVSITFMACRTGICCPPVTGKLVSVQVPGVEELLP